jgi:hypothetical protein
MCRGSWAGEIVVRDAFGDAAMNGYGELTIRTCVDACLRMSDCDTLRAVWESALYKRSGRGRRPAHVWERTVGHSLSKEASSPQCHR